MLCTLPLLAGASNGRLSAFTSHPELRRDTAEAAKRPGSTVRTTPDVRRLFDVLLPNAP